MSVTHVALAGASTLAIAKVQCEAKKHGTFVSPTDGQIIYVDPDHDDERHHSPLLDRQEAAYAFERGLIEDPADAKEADEEKAEEQQRDPNALGTVGTERTEEFAEQDAEAGEGSGTLDSRSSTAWNDQARVEGGAHGFADGVRVAEVPVAETADVDQESGDDDAPPAPAPAKRGRKPAGG